MKKKIFLICFLLVVCFVFVDIISAETYTNFTPQDFVSCGGNYLDKIPSSLPKIISIIYTIIQIAIPIVLVIFGMLDLFKSITAGKEDEMKKGRQTFIQRLIFAAIIFFSFMFVKLLISLVAENGGTKILQCAECFIENKCD